MEEPATVKRGSPKHQSMRRRAILAAMRRASSRVSSFVIKKSSAEISALIALCVTVLCVPMVPSAVNILVLGV